MGTIAVDYHASHGYVRFVVEETDNTHTVYRLDGTRLATITGFESGWWISGTSGYGEDYRMLLGQAVTYVLAPTGSRSDNAAYPRATVTTQGDIAWLRNPIYNATAIPVFIVDTGSESEAVRQHIHEVSGRQLPLVVHDVRLGRSGTLTLLVLSRAQRDYLEGPHMLGGGEPLLLLMCNQQEWKPCMMAVGNATWTLMPVPGTYRGTQVPGPVWSLTLEYTEVDDPFRGSQERIAAVLYSDVAANLVVPPSTAVPYAYATLPNEYDSYLDLAIGQKVVT